MGWVDGVMVVMVGLVGDEGDQFVMWCVFGVQVVYMCVDCVYQIDVFCFIFVVDIVVVVQFVFFQYQQQGIGMIFDIQLVVDIVVIVIDWDGMVMQCVQDDDWYQFFGEVEWFVIVGIIGQYYWQVIGFVSGVYQMV